MDGEGGGFDGYGCWWAGLHRWRTPILAGRGFSALVAAV